MVEQIQKGDYVAYYGRSGHPCHGYVAERAISPLTGNPCFRVVDKITDIIDPRAGIWRDLEGRLISARSPE